MKPQKKDSFPSDKTPLDLSIEDLAITYVTEKARDRLIRWIKIQVAIIGIPITIVSMILAFLGVRGVNIVNRARKTTEEAIEAIEILEKTMPQVSAFAKKADSLRTELADIGLRASTSSSEIERLKTEISFLQKGFEGSKAVLDDLLRELSKTDAQLKNTKKKYEEEMRKLEERKALFKENQGFSITIQHSSDTKQRAQKCKETLGSNGFQVELRELSEPVAALLRKRDFSEKVCYFDEELFQKAKEVAELLKPATFKIMKASEKGEFSFIIWVL